MIVLINAYSLFLVRCNVPQVYDGSAFCDSQSLTDASRSGLCHAVQRRNPLHSRSCLSKPRISYQTMSKHCNLRGNLRQASSFMSKHKLLPEYKGLWVNNKTADSSPKDMKDYEWATYMTNGMRLLSCNDSDFQCEGQTDICQITPSGNKCKGISSIFHRANQLSNLRFVSLRWSWPGSLF